MAILAIDQGTSGTKAVVVDGEVLSVAERSVRPRYGDGGMVEQDPAELLASVLDAGNEAVETAGVPLDAVALANQGETVLAWDRDTGEPLTAAISWQDSRSQEICDELQEHAELVRRRTGLQLDPYFSAPKMAWLRRHWTQSGVVTTTDTWLVHQLTGEFVTDVTTASRSAVLDVDRLRWDPQLLEVFGLQEEALPDLVANDDVVGYTNVFGADVAVAGLIVDQQAALLAESCLEAGTAKCTYGTGAFLLANVGSEAPRFNNGLTTSVAWKLRNKPTYCADGQVYTAASAVRWLIDLGLIESASQLDQVAAPSSGELVCIPSFAGLAAPWWRSDIGAVFSGLTLASGRGELVRSVLDGIAAQVTELTDLIVAGTGQPIERLRVDGGLTQSRTLMQAQADLLRAPIDVFGSPHATALGAAGCARLALENTLTTADAPLAWNPSATYTPHASPEDAHTFRTTWSDVLDAHLAGRRS